MRQLATRAVSALCCWGLAGVLCGQPARFEAAAIKPAGPVSPQEIRAGVAHIGTRITGDRVEIGYATVGNMILQAYQLEPYQLVGAEAVNGARFNITAKLLAGATREQVPEMLKNLLAERFGLVAHASSKVLAVYALVVAKGGPKLVAAPDGATPSFHLSRNANGSYRVETTSTLSRLASTLRSYLERPVIDKTGLTGTYSMTLIVNREGDTEGPPDGGPPLMGSGGPVGSNFIEAVKALGLKLEPAKEPVSVLVVDHVNPRPTEN